MIYKCEVCGKEFDTISGAQACEDKHVIAEQEHMEAVQKEWEADKARAEAIKTDIEDFVEEANCALDEYKETITSAHEILDDYHEYIEKIRGLVKEYNEVVPFSQTKMVLNSDGVKVDIKGGFKDPNEIDLKKEKASIDKPIYPLVEAFKDIFRGF